MFIEDVINSYYENKGDIVVSSKYSVEDIKKIVFTGMKNTNRFNGITERPYCLIEHSWLVSKYAQDLYKIYHYDKFVQWEYDFVGFLGMVHDIGEIVVGDSVYPLKTKLNCEKCLKPLEERFIGWFIDKCYEYNRYYNEISSLKELFNYCFDYVNQADHQIGTLEMIGISVNDNFESRNQFANMLSANLCDISSKTKESKNIIDAFEERLIFLVNQIKKI